MRIRQLLELLKSLVLSSPISRYTYETAYNGDPAMKLLTASYSSSLERQEI